MEHIISKFVSAAEIGEMKPFGNGHINDTYVISDREGTPRWILQRVNHLVFPRIEVLQRNVAIVSDTMRERLTSEGDPEAERKYLHFLPNLEEPEKNYYHDGENYWRVCRFIPESGTPCWCSLRSLRRDSFGHPRRLPWGDDRKLPQHALPSPAAP